MNSKCISHCLTISFALLCACSPSISTVQNDGIQLSKRDHFATLVAGGTKWPGIEFDSIDRQDSLVYFDFHPTLAITNNTTWPLHLVGNCNVELIDSIPKEIQPTKQTAISNSIGSFLIDLGSVAAGASVTLDTTFVVKINEKVRGMPLGYGITVSANRAAAHFVPPVSATGLFDSVPFDSRYRGYIETTESSPNPIAVRDGPDDDWISTRLFPVQAAFPNPAYGASKLSFTVLDSPDSIRVELHQTPHHVSRVFVDGPQSLSPGVWTVEMDYKGLTPGLYRVELTKWKDGDVQHTHGDVVVQ